eukprot:16430245-Heterocapsa_arctica.AAC.1
MANAIYLFVAMVCIYASQNASSLSSRTIELVVLGTPRHQGPLEPHALARRGIPHVHAWRPTRQSHKIQGQLCRVRRARGVV